MSAPTVMKSWSDSEQCRDLPPSVPPRNYYFFKNNQYQYRQQQPQQQMTIPTVPYIYQEKAEQQQYYMQTPSLFCENYNFPMIDEDPEYQTIAESACLVESQRQYSYCSEYSSVSMPSIKQQVSSTATTPPNPLPSSASHHHFLSGQSHTSFEPLPVERVSKRHYPKKESNRHVRMIISTLPSTSVLQMPSTSCGNLQHHSSHSSLPAVPTAPHSMSTLIPPPPNFRNSSVEFDESDLSLETKPIGLADHLNLKKKSYSKSSRKRKAYRNKVTTQAVINYREEDRPHSSQLTVMPFSSADHLSEQPLTSNRWYFR